MGTQFSTIEFLTEQLNGTGVITHKKMFGEYCVYVNSKPVFLVCDDTLYVHMLPELAQLLKDKPTGIPYPGAKPRYIIEEIDDREFLCRLAETLDAITPLPVKKNKNR